MSPSECLQLYSVLKLHFSSSQYDGEKYNWKLKSNIDFSKRNDKHFFAKLSRQSDPKGLLIANLSLNPKLWIGELFLFNSQKNYTRWRKYQDAIAYHFTEELKLLDKTSFKVVNGQHPDALKKFIADEITITTMSICNNFINYTETWNKSLDGDPVWDKYRFQIERYKPFISYNKQIIKPILSSWLKNST